MNNQKGLTLAEVLVALFISTVIGGLLLVIMTNSTGLFYKESSRIGQGLGVNDALMLLRQTIREASSIEVSYSDGSTAYNSGTERLVLSVPVLDASGDLISNTYDYFVYFQEAGTLRLKSFPDSQSSEKAADRVLATGVEKIVFQYYDGTNPEEVLPGSANRVRATLTLRQKVGAETNITVATSEANLRND